MGFRIAFRRLSQQPLRTLAVVITIALAVSVNCALFSVLDGLLFRPLPFEDPDRIVAVAYRPRGGPPSDPASLQAEADRREILGAAIERSPLVVIASDAGTGVVFDPDQQRALGLNVQAVDSHFFPLLGLSPVPGTNFTPDDERSDAARSRDSAQPLPVIISHDLWRTLYAGDPAALGAHELAGRAVHVVGVVPPGMKFPGETDIWAPIAPSRTRLPAYVRLAPGASIAQLADAFPELAFTRLRDQVYPGGGQQVALLCGAAVVLLLVAWVQVAGIVFSDALARLRQVGVQLALGAGRFRIVREFAAESALIAAAALALASIGIRPLTIVIVSVLPSEVTRGQYLDPDARTFAFLYGLSILGFVLLAAATFTATRRVTPMTLLNGRSFDRWVGVERVRSFVLMAQMALTCLLLYVCGLAMHSVIRAEMFDYGFDAEHVLVFTPPNWVRPGRTTAELFADYAERNRTMGASVDMLRRLPDVIGVSTFFAGPFGIGVHDAGMITLTHFNGRALSGLTARSDRVGESFVRAFGLRTRGGTDFEDPDYRGRHDVAIVNETLAERLSPAMRVEGADLSPSVVGGEIQGRYFRARIIGVIGDIVDSTLSRPAEPQIYMPARESGGYGVAIRLAGPTERTLPALRGAMQNVWGPQALLRFNPMSEELQRVLVPYRGQATLLGLILACCLPLAVLGLVAALTQSVRLQSREIAVRIAIGADPGAVRRRVVRRALLIVSAGVVLGTSLGAGVGRIVAHELFQVSPIDWASILAVTTGLITIGWCCALGPARQATCIDPASVLRQ